MSFKKPIKFPSAETWTADTVESGVEPGASTETMLLTSDTYEDCKEELSSEVANKMMEMHKQMETISIPSDTSDESNCFNSMSNNETSHKIGCGNTDFDPMRCDDWLSQKKHIFVLSQAGKPIYSRYCSEDKLVTVMGVMQALISFVQANNDTIKSVHAGDTTFVFLVKGPLILVTISKTMESTTQLILQLNYVYNQILSVLTQSQLTRVYENRRNFDLRRLLTGSERLIDHLLNFMDHEPAFFLGAVKCLPLSPSMRDSITQTIIQTCGKIKNLVFAILLANNQLITLVRMKKFFIHPADLHLILNLVDSSESFKSAESWTPICLPKFDSNGFMHAHVSYLAEDCQACLLLLTVDRDVFFTLSEAKQKIVEKLRRTNCLEAINESMNKDSITISKIGLSEIRHALYKCKSTAQFWSSGFQAPYLANQDIERLLQCYQCLHHKLHSPTRPLKLIFQQSDKETLLAWITAGFELFVTFEPLVTKTDAIHSVEKLLKWIKKEEEKLFILNSPTF